MYHDDKAQISAEMILLIGGLIVLVIVVGIMVLNVANSVAGNVTTVVNTARDTTINRLWAFHYTKFFLNEKLTFKDFKTLFFYKEYFF